MPALVRCVALLVTWGLAQPPAMAAPSTATDTAVAAQVDATEVDMSGAIAKRIRDTIANDQTRHALALDTEAANRVDVVVRWIDKDTLHYLYVLEARRADGEARQFQGDCPTCTDEELAASISSTLGEVAEFLRAEPEEPLIVEDTYEEPSADIKAPPLGSSEPVDRGNRAGPSIRIGGIVAASAGVALGGLSAWLFVSSNNKDDELSVSPDDLDQREENDLQKLGNQVQYRRSGGIATAVGAGVLLVGGAAMLIVDGVHRRRDRDRVALVPTLSPTFGGLVLTGRF